MPPRVKICCIASTEEAQLAISAGASALGLVSTMPSGPGVITEQQIRAIADSTPPGIATFLLTCAQDPAAIIEQNRRCRANTLQLCDWVDPAAYETLRAAMPGVKVVQVIHVCDDEAIAQSLEAARGGADALLLDSGRPNQPVKELGGTGRTHDWTISRRIREAIPIHIWLAGGLRHDNVAEAIHQVNPFGIDLCSSVRSNGHLDDEKLNQLMWEVRGTSPFRREA